MSDIVALLLTGLASASALFLVASGLSIIFGVTRIVNFAHGSFYMVGAYVAYTLIDTWQAGIPGFWGAVVLAAVAVGLLGAVVETTVLRPIYRSPELFQLVATFGVVLIVQDATLALWGAEDYLGPRAPGLDGAVAILDTRVPEYDLVLIGIGPLVLAGLWLLFHRTRWGKLVRAATQDREMVAALGVNARRLFTGVFFLGALLAGLGGALQVPREPVSLLMDLSIIADVFVVVVIGGMGSIQGAYLAALLIGVLNAFGVQLLPKLTLVLTFLVMAVVLVVRPWGLLGRPEVQGAATARAAPAPLAPPRARAWIGTAVVLAALILLPLAAGEFTVVLATEILIFALFAASLHFMMGPGGMVSFGHAAYFGLGAYAAALLVRYAGASMELAIAAAPVAAGLGALLFGWFCVRLSGVYLAMLSLAFAQITWSVVFQWYEVTGGDDGVLGIWPSDWAGSRTAFYYLTLALAAGGIVALRHLTFSPFGYALRGGRDSPLRAEAVGIDVRRQQWATFALAGLFAGIAGGLFVFSKGSVFPDELAIPRSIDALIMVLLGGVETLSGPVVGALAYIGLEDWLSRLQWWRAILGALIVAICVLMPQGLVGTAARLSPWQGRRTRAAP